MKFEITEGAQVHITEHPLPVYLPGGVLIGKATVVQGLNDTAVIIETELDIGIVPALIQGGLTSLSFNYEPSQPLTKEENSNASTTEVQDQAHSSSHE